MLRLKLNMKNLIKRNFYGFESNKLTRLINLAFLLLFILFFCGFYFLDSLSKDYIINKLKPSDQFLIKNGFKIFRKASESELLLYESPGGNQVDVSTASFSSSRD